MATVCPSGAIASVADGTLGRVTAEIDRMLPPGSESLSSTYSSVVRPGRAPSLSSTALGGWLSAARGSGLESLGLCGSDSGGGFTDDQLSTRVLARRSYTAPD